jgi:protein phosphatase
MSMPDNPNGAAFSSVAELFAEAGFPPPSATVQVEFGVHTARGRSQSVNADHYLVIRLGRHQETLLSSLSNQSVVKRFDEAGYAMVVADGMNAGDDGDAAGRLAIVTLVHLVRQFGKWRLRIDDTVAREIMDRAEGFFRHIDSALVQQGRTNPSERMQTALTAVFSAGRDLFFAHVGHSRAYLLRERHLMRLTRDHTIAGQFPTAGPAARLVDVSAAGVDLRHLLTDTLGMTGSIGPEIDLERLQLLDGDVLLLCTNGLTDAVAEDLIAEVLASDRSPDERARTLVEMATSRRGEDDVTAVVAHYRLPM